MQFSIRQLLGVMTAVAPAAAFAQYVGPTASMSMGVSLVVFVPLLVYLFAKAVLECSDARAARLTFVASAGVMVAIVGFAAASSVRGLWVGVGVAAVFLWSGQADFLCVCVSAHRSGLRSAGIEPSEPPDRSAAGSARPE